MALYGVQICPVLGERGFSFGCRYTGAFIAIVLITESMFNGSLWGLALRACRKNDNLLRWIRCFPVASLLVHAGALFMGAAWLRHYLFQLQAPAPTIERMTLALFYASLLLSVLQANIVDWLIHGWMRIKINAERIAPWASSPDRASFTLRWIYGNIWALMPFLSFLAITGLAIFRKFHDLIGTEELRVEDANRLLIDITQITALTLAWLALVRTFSLLKERRLVRDIHAHLESLSRLEADYRSPTIASGRWESIFSALNHTGALIGQRTRLVRGFSSYVTRTVVDKVLECGELKPEGEMRDLVILTSDLRDFTLTSSQLSAEQVVRMLNIYFTDMIEVLSAHDVTLDKFIGDGILAYVDPRDADCDARKAAELAARAALAMHEQLALTNAKLVSMRLPQLRLGVGVHRGSVILGSIGSPEKMQYTIVGDPVNVASRLEGLCKKLRSGVVLSETIYSHLSTETKARFESLGPQEIRGAAACVPVYVACQENRETASDAA